MARHLTFAIGLLLTFPAFAELRCKVIEEQMVCLDTTPNRFKENGQAIQFPSPTLLPVDAGPIFEPRTVPERVPSSSDRAAYRPVTPRR